MSALVVAHPGRSVAYGAAELKLAEHRNAFLALLVSILVHFSIIGFYYLGEMFDTDQVLPAGPAHGGPVVILDPLPPLPGVYQLPTPAGPLPQIANDAGVPVPVPDDPSIIEKTIASQRKLVELVDPHGVAESPGEPSKPLAIDGDDNLPPEIFVPVERAPVIVKAVPPVYPPLALKAGIEGKVYVKIWVDRQGKIRQVEVVKSNNDIFNEAAVEAAKQFVFTPAYMNNGPVSVWVAVPFTFRLLGNQ